jgi:hypothetical protein
MKRLSPFVAALGLAVGVVVSSVVSGTFASRDFRTATHRIHRGPDYPSRVDVPVVRTR